jgi:hypothetical protein
MPEIDPPMDCNATTHQDRPPCMAPPDKRAEQGNVAPLARLTPASGQPVAHSRRSIP